MAKNKKPHQVEPGTAEGQQGIYSPHSTRDVTVPDTDNLIASRTFNMAQHLFHCALCMSYRIRLQVGSEKKSTGSKLLTTLRQALIAGRH